MLQGLLPSQVFEQEGAGRYRVILLIVQEAFQFWQERHCTQRKAFLEQETLLGQCLGGAL